MLKSHNDTAHEKALNDEMHVIVQKAIGCKSSC